MKIAHIAIATPGRSGLYETTRDLVVAERALGVDARIVDPVPTAFHPGSADRGVPMGDMAFAQSADWLVDHSGLDAPAFDALATPVVYVNHGRPASSFIGEHTGGPPVLSYWYKQNRDPRYKAVVTFWPEHVRYLENIWTDKPVHALYPPVDLAHWTPGPTPYQFAGKGGAPNVVIADMWRDDVNPAPCIAAFLAFAADHPTAKLHLYGLPPQRRGIDLFLNLLAGRGQLGVAQGWAADLRTVYRATDLVISPHRIYTRTIREAMACGCQVVSGRDAEPDDVQAFADAMAQRLLAKQDSRVAAEALFNPAETARQLLAVVA